MDGYNVINSWPDLRDIKEYSYESARQKLMEVLQNYSSYKGDRLFLVFDAHLVIGSVEKKDKVGNNLIVVFTKEGQTADSYIEKAVNNIGRKVEVCVVTSDSLEQQLAFQRGATRMSSVEFYHEVMSIEDKIKIETKKKYLENRHLLSDRLQEDVLEKLEKIRRSR